MTQTPRSRRPPTGRALRLGGVAILAALAAVLVAASPAAADSSGSVPAPPQISDGATFDIGGATAQAQISLAARVDLGDTTLSNLTVANGATLTNTLGLFSTGKLAATVKFGRNVDPSIDAVLWLNGTPVRISGPLSGPQITFGQAALAAAPQVRLVGAVIAAGDPGFGDAAAGLLEEWLRRTGQFWLLGLVFLLILPRFNRVARGAVRPMPWTRLGLGIVLLLSLPVLAIILFIAGLSVGAWWLGILVLFAYGVALAFAYTAAGLMLGRWAFDRMGLERTHVILVLLAGVAALSLLGLLPYVGALVNVVALIFGLGALALAGRTAVEPEPAPAVVAIPAAAATAAALEAGPAVEAMPPAPAASAVAGTAPAGIEAGTASSAAGPAAQEAASAAGEAPPEGAAVRTAAESAPAPAESPAAATVDDPAPAPRPRRAGRARSASTETGVTEPPAGSAPDTPDAS